MAPTRGYRPATYVPLRAGAAAKAAFVERVLECGTAADAARLMLQWLGEHSETERAFCALVDEDDQRLEGIAGDGVSHGAIASFSVELDQEDHPLVLALAGDEAVFFGPSDSSRHPRLHTPLGRDPFHAVPLRRQEQEEERALGLLLIAGLDGLPGRDVEWATQVLAAKLLCLRHGVARRKQLRAHRQRALLQEMVDSVSDPVLLTNPDGQILQSNAHAERLFTASEGESEGRQRAVALNNMLFSAAAFTESARTDPGRGEVLLVDPTTGEDLLFELIKTPTAVAGSGEGNVCVLRNVTDLREATREIEENYRRLQQAEASARAERDRLDLILNALADPVLVTRPDGTIAKMNPPAELLFTLPSGVEGAERNIVTNHTVFSSFVSNFYAGHSIRAREELSLQEPLTSSALPMAAIAGKVIDNQGAVTAVVTILHDRREAIEKARLYEQVKRHSEELEQKVQEATIELLNQNEQLRRQTIALEEGSRLKSQFLANVSHELRTPLHSIMGYTDLLVQGIAGELTRPQLEKLQRVDSNAEHLLKIINDLLDISRIEAGKVVLELSTFEVGELLDEVFQEIEPVVARSRLTLTREVAPDIESIESDRKKLKQIVINLLSNAVKFTHEGFVRVQVEIASEGRLRIAVADTGIGIAEEDLGRIFEDFGQVTAQPSGTSSGGTGLGLAICRRLADALGGSISLVSRQGVGSTFTLDIPVEPNRRTDGGIQS